MADQTQIVNRASGQVFTSADGVVPRWVAQVGDAELLDVELTGSHVKATWPSIPVNAAEATSTDKGDGPLELSLTVRGSFQEYHDQKVQVGRGSVATLVYFVPDPNVPSVCYGLVVDDNPPFNLGEAVLGSTIVD